MKRILCLIENLGQGGAERQLVGLTCMLKDKGFPVKLITYSNDPFYKHILDENNVENDYIAEARNKFRRIPSIIREIRAYKPDVLITFLSGPSSIACIAKMLGGRFRLIVSERNTTQTLSLRDKVIFHLYRYADVIVPNSYSQTSFLCDHYPKFKGKIRTITNFIDTELFKPKEDDKAWSLSHLLCVARIAPQKNVLKFLDAIKILKDKGLCFHFDWFGLKNEEYYNKCENKRLELGLEDYITFHDAVTDILVEYHNADALVLPSLYEGFPNAICEAMSCGLPILCSNICDNKIIVRENVNGLLFNPTSAIDMAEVMEIFLTMTESEQRKMSLQSRTFALKDFSKEVFINKYIDAIENAE